ncbi:hypothetical protein ACE6H2_008358 [Prunus campanulata]
MMLTNCLFRSGGCSMLFTNNRGLKHQAMLKLKHLVRTRVGSSDEAYNRCIQAEDESGYQGFRLTKNLVKAATQGFTINLQVLVPKVLPLREILRYLLASLLHNLSTKSQKLEAARGDGMKLNLKTGIEHFCIHPGGRAIIYGIGNTSAAGFWYVLGYMEAKNRLKKGKRILMSGFGAGFKCNNVVWEVVKDLDDANVWKDCIDSYPPNTLVNPFMEKYSWLNDEILNFDRFDFSQLAASFEILLVKYQCFSKSHYEPRAVVSM